MIELKECPYCWNKNVGFAKFNGQYSIVCPVYACPRIIEETFETLEEAVDAWNEMDRSDVRVNPTFYNERL